MHGSLRWLFLLLLASLKCAAWATNDAGCAISDALLQPSACGQSCRKETLEALRAIYRDTNGSSMWSFSDSDQQPAPKGNWSDAICIHCSSGAKILPSYCCWEGVSCCQGPHNSSDSPGCDLYSVTALQPQSGNLTGNFEKLVPHISVLHEYGLQYLDMGRNFITGSIPPTIANLSNLKALMLASNSKCSQLLCIGSCCSLHCRMRLSIAATCHNSGQAKSLHRLDYAHTLMGWYSGAVRQL